MEYYYLLMLKTSYIIKSRKNQLLLTLPFPFLLMFVWSQKLWSERGRTERNIKSLLLLIRKDENNDVKGRA